jgi:phenylpropionate dioxygenase-like ring-hydroxylating dioxygenase large terminal subunit
MQRNDVITMTERVLAHIAHDTLDIADGVWREPRDAFVSAERLEAERGMMCRVPHVIGWAGEISRPGDFTTKDVLGVPVLVVRDRAGEVRAFVNGCAHRGAQVAAGSGNANRLTCPYHGWTYGLDGCLAGAPSRKMFDGANLETRGLIPLPVSVRAGLISVGLEAGVDAGSCLDGVEEALAGFRFAEYEHVETRRFDLAANWKLAVDVNFEGYHFPFLHRNSIDPFVSNNSVCDTFGRHARWAFPFRDIVRLNDLPQDEWPPYFDGTVVYLLFPSCVLIELPQGPQLFRVYPGKAPGESIVYVSQGSAAPVRTDEERAANRATMQGLCALLRDEDFPAAEACQRGLEAGVDHVVFGRNEPMLQHLAATWNDSLEGGIDVPRPSGAL